MNDLKVVKKNRVRSELKKTIKKTLDSKLDELTRGSLSPKELLELLAQNYKIRKMELG